MTCSYGGGAHDIRPLLCQHERKEGGSIDLPSCPSSRARLAAWECSGRNHNRRCRPNTSAKFWRQPRSKGHGLCAPQLYRSAVSAARVIHGASKAHKTHLMGRFSKASMVVWLTAISRKCITMNPISAKLHRMTQREGCVRPAAGLAEGCRLLA